MCYREYDADTRAGLLTGPTSRRRAIADRWRWGQAAAEASGDDQSTTESRPVLVGAEQDHADEANQPDGNAHAEHGTPPVWSHTHTHTCTYGTRYVQHHQSSYMFDEIIPALIKLVVDWRLLLKQFYF